MGVIEIAAGVGGSPSPVHPAVAQAVADITVRVRSHADEIGNGALVLADLAGVEWRGRAAAAYHEALTGRVLDLRRAADRVLDLADSLDRLRHEATDG